jgi:hypothetical protein
MNTVLGEGSIFITAEYFLVIETDRNQGHGLAQVQKCGTIKPIKGITL